MASDRHDDEPRPGRPRRRAKRAATAVERPAPSGPDAPAEPRRTLDAAGRDRPAFVLDFPADPALDRLVAAFERGDYRWVRREAPLVADATDSEAVRKAALELRRRIDPDPLAILLLGIAAALLGFLIVWTYAIPHAH